MTCKTSNRKGIREITKFTNGLNSRIIRPFSVFTLGVLAFGSFVIGCAQPEGTVGSGVGGGPEGVQSQIICPVQADTSFRALKVGTGGSAYLYVGSSNGITSEAALRFNRPVTSAGMRVDSARVQVAYQGGIGNGVVPAVEASLIYFPWIESTPPTRSDLTGGMQLVASSTSNADSGGYYFTVDTSEINAWFKSVDSSRADTGFSDPARADTALTIVLRSSNANDKLLRFRSRAATVDSLRPYLMIFATFTDSVGSDTIKVGPIGDLFLPEDSTPLPANRLSIGGGSVIRSAMHFKLDSLWSKQTSSYIVVNRAVLTLTRDRSLFAWSPTTKSVWPYQMTSKRWLTELDSAEYSGFVLTPTAVDSTSDTLQILVSGPAVNWARGDSTNFGVLLESAGEGLDIERIGFYDSSDPDPTKHPRVTVYFTEMQR